MMTRTQKSSEEATSTAASTTTTTTTTTSKTSKGALPKVGAKKSTGATTKTTNTTTTTTASGPVTTGTPSVGEYIEIERAEFLDETMLSGTSEHDVTISASGSQDALGINEDFSGRLNETVRDLGRENAKEEAGFMQAEIMRNVEKRLSEIIPGIVQKSLSSITQHTCLNYAPPEPRVTPASNQIPNLVNSVNNSQRLPQGVGQQHQPDFQQNNPRQQPANPVQNRFSSHRHVPLSTLGQPQQGLRNNNQQNFNNPPPTIPIQQLPLNFSQQQQWNHLNPQNPPTRQQNISQWAEDRHVPQSSFLPPLQGQLPPTYMSNHQGDHLDAAKWIHKWNLKFDGTQKTSSVEDFVFRVDTLREDFNCSEDDVVRNLHHFLQSPALDWFWNYRRLLNRVPLWKDLKEALIIQYHRYENDFEIQKKILDRRQLPNESFDEFCNTVLALRNQQNNPISEQDLVEIMKGNLRPAMSQLLFSIRVLGLSAFKQECRRAENLLANQRQFTSKYPMRQVNELAFEQPYADEQFEISAISGERKLICWNCKAEGHTFMDCFEEKVRIFCYKCGLEDVVTPKCPTCQGNRRGNGPRTGVEARSQNPATHFQKPQQH